MNKLHFKKITSGLLLVFFTAVNLAPVPRAYAAPEIPSARPVFDLEIPSEFGAIQKLSPGPGPTIIQIQTAHGNFEAQKKIQAILHHLKDQHGFKLLLLEGSASKLDPQLLNIFPGNAALNMKFAELLAKEALVKGDELFLLEEKDAEGHGIEDIPIYRAARKTFKKVLLEKQASEKFLQDLNLQVERLTASYLNQDLRDFLKIRENHEKEITSFSTWLREIKKYALKTLQIDLSSPLTQFDWPMLVRAVKIEEFESKNSHKNGRIILQNEIEPGPFLSELEKITSLITGKLARTEEEKFAVQFLKKYRILQGLLNIELQPADYETLKKDPASFQPTVLTHAFKNLNHGKRVKDFKFKNLREIDSLFDLAVAFYNSTETRDRAMLENVQKKLQETGAQKAVVITGGFHAKAFGDFFTSRGFNYALVSPKITSAQGREEYLRAALQIDLPVKKSTMDFPRRMEPWPVQAAMDENLKYVWGRMGVIKSELRNSAVKGLLKGIKGDVETLRKRFNPKFRAERKELATESKNNLLKLFIKHHEEGRFWEMLYVALPLIESMLKKIEEYRDDTGIAAAEATFLETTVYGQILSVLHQLFLFPSADGILRRKNDAYKIKTFDIYKGIFLKVRNLQSNIAGDVTEQGTQKKEGPSDRSELRSQQTDGQPLEQNYISESTRYKKIRSVLKLWEEENENKYGLLKYLIAERYREVPGMREFIVRLMGTTESGSFNEAAGELIGAYFMELLLQAQGYQVEVLTISRQIGYREFDVMFFIEPKPGKIKENGGVYFEKGVYFMEAKEDAAENLEHLIHTTVNTQVAHQLENLFYLKKTGVPVKGVFVLAGGKSSKQRLFKPEAISERGVRRSRGVNIPIHSLVTGPFEVETEQAPDGRKISEPHLRQLDAWFYQKTKIEDLYRDVLAPRFNLPFKENQLQGALDQQTAYHELVVREHYSASVQRESTEVKLQAGENDYERRERLVGQWTETFTLAGISKKDEVEAVLEWYFLKSLKRPVDELSNDLSKTPDLQAAWNWLKMKFDRHTKVKKIGKKPKIEKAKGPLKNKFEKTLFGDRGWIAVFKDVVSPEEAEQRIREYFQPAIAADDDQEYRKLTRALFDEVIFRHGDDRHAAWQEMLAKIEENKKLSATSSELRASPVDELQRRRWLAIDYLASVMPVFEENDHGLPSDFFYRIRDELGTQIAAYHGSDFDAIIKAFDMVGLGPGDNYWTWGVGTGRDLLAANAYGADLAQGEEFEEPIYRAAQSLIFGGPNKSLLTGMPPEIRGNFDVSKIKIAQADWFKNGILSEEGVKRLKNYDVFFYYAYGSSRQDEMAQKLAAHMHDRAVLVVFHGDSPWNVPRNLVELRIRSWTGGIFSFVSLYVKPGSPLLEIQNSKYIRDLKSKTAGAKSLYLAGWKTTADTLKILEQFPDVTEVSVYESDHPLQNVLQMARGYFGGIGLGQGKVTSGVPGSWTIHWQGRKINFKWLSQEDPIPPVDAAFMNDPRELRVVGRRVDTAMFFLNAVHESLNPDGLLIMEEGPQFYFPQEFAWFRTGRIQYEGDSSAEEKSSSRARRIYRKLAPLVRSELRNRVAQKQTESAYLPYPVLTDFKYLKIKLQNVKEGKPPVTLELVPQMGAQLKINVSVNNELTGDFWLNIDANRKIFQINLVYPFSEALDPTPENGGVMNTILAWLAWETSEEGYAFANTGTENPKLIHLYRKYFEIDEKDEKTSPKKFRFIADPKKNTPRPLGEIQRSESRLSDKIEKAVERLDRFRRSVPKEISDEYRISTRTTSPDLYGITLRNFVRTFWGELTAILGDDPSLWPSRGIDYRKGMPAQKLLELFVAGWHSLSFFGRYSSNQDMLREDYVKDFENEIRARFSQNPKRKMQLFMGAPGFFQEAIEALWILDKLGDEASEIIVLDLGGKNSVGEKFLNDEIYYDPLDVEKAAALGIPVEKYFDLTDSGYRLKDSKRKRFHFILEDLNDPGSIGRLNSLNLHPDFIFFRQIFQYLDEDRKGPLIKFLHSILQADGVLYSGFPAHHFPFALGRPRNVPSLHLEKDWTSGVVADPSGNETPLRSATKFHKKGYEIPGQGSWPEDPFEGEKTEILEGRDYLALIEFLREFWGKLPESLEGTDSEEIIFGWSFDELLDKQRDLKTKISDPDFLDWLQTQDIDKQSQFFDHYMRLFPARAELRTTNKPWEATGGLLSKTDLEKEIQGARESYKLKGWRFMASLAALSHEEWDKLKEVLVSRGIPENVLTQSWAEGKSLKYSPLMELEDDPDLLPFMREMPYFSGFDQMPKQHWLKEKVVNRRLWEGMLAVSQNHQVVAHGTWGNYAGTMGALGRSMRPFQLHWALLGIMLDGRVEYGDAAYLIQQTNNPMSNAADYGPYYVIFPPGYRGVKSRSYTGFRVLGGTPSERKDHLVYLVPVEESRQFFERALDQAVRFGFLDAATAEAEKKKILTYGEWSRLDQHIPKILKGEKPPRDFVAARSPLELLEWNDPQVLTYFHALLAKNHFPLPRTSIKNGEPQTGGSTERNPKVFSLENLKAFFKNETPVEAYERLKSNLFVYRIGEEFGNQMTSFCAYFGIWPDGVSWFWHVGSFEENGLVRTYVDEKKRKEGRTHFKILAHATWNGEDAYGIALMLRHLFPGTSFEVIGKDIIKPNRDELNWLPVEDIPSFMRGDFEKYFEYQINEPGEEGIQALSLKKEHLPLVELSRGDIREPLQEKGLDIVYVGKLLMLYVTDKDELVRSVENLRASLLPDGLLIVPFTNSAEAQGKRFSAFMDEHFVRTGKLERVGKEVYRKTARAELRADQQETLQFPLYLEADVLKALQAETVKTVHLTHITSTGFSNLYHFWLPLGGGKKVHLLLKRPRSMPTPEEQIALDRLNRNEVEIMADIVNSPDFPKPGGERIWINGREWQHPSVRLGVWNEPLQGLVFPYLNPTNGATDAEDVYITRHTPLRPQDYLVMALHMAGALGFLHHMGIVHHDIKPGNFFVFPNGVVLTDFNLAYNMSGSREMLRGGTPLYAPREQWEGAPADYKHDVYALGMTLLRVWLGGQHDSQTSKFSSLPADEIAQQVNFRNCPLRKVIEKALGPNPYANAIEMEAAIRNARERFKRQGNAPFAQTEPEAADEALVISPGQRVVPKVPAKLGTIGETGASNAPVVRIPSKWDDEEAINKMITAIDPELEFIGIEGKGPTGVIYLVKDKKKNQTVFLKIPIGQDYWAQNGLPNPNSNVRGPVINKSAHQLFEDIRLGFLAQDTGFVPKPIGFYHVKLLDLDGEIFPSYALKMEPITGHSLEDYINEGQPENMQNFGKQFTQMVLSFRMLRISVQGLNQNDNVALQAGNLKITFGEQKLKLLGLWELTDEEGGSIIDIHALSILPPMILQAIHRVFATAPGKKKIAPNDELLLAGIQEAIAEFRINDTAEDLTPHDPPEGRAELRLTPELRDHLKKTGFLFPIKLAVRYEKRELTKILTDLGLSSTSGFDKKQILSAKKFLGVPSRSEIRDAFVLGADLALNEGGLVLLETVLKDSRAAIVWNSPEALRQLENYNKEREAKGLEPVPLVENLEQAKTHFAGANFYGFASPDETSAQWAKILKLADNLKILTAQRLEVFAGTFGISGLLESFKARFGFAKSA